MHLRSQSLLLTAAVVWRVRGSDVRRVHWLRHAPLPRRRGVLGPDALFPPVPGLLFFYPRRNGVQLPVGPTFGYIVMMRTVSVRDG